MLACGTESGAVHRANHQRHRRPATEHVPQFGGLVENLIEAYAHKVNEHQFRHGSQSGRRCPHRRTDKSAFANRRIPHALLTELGNESLGHSQHATPCVLLARSSHPAGHVLAHDDDSRIAAHLETQCLVYRFAE